MTHNQKHALRQLMHRPYLTSEWTNGAGKHTTRRAIPPYAERIERWELETRALPKRITSVFARHPRAQAIVAIINMRAARKALQDQD